MTRRLAACLAILVALGTGTGAGTGAAAQEGAPFLIINQERILTGSRTGQALLAQEEEARDALRAEARAIDRRFEEEERYLTELRAELPPEEFRAIADEFDERVVEARRQQDARSTALVLEFDQRRRQFYADVAPILVRLLSRYGAHAILDESSVLLADQSLNITDAVIAEIDAQADEGDGTDEQEAEPETDRQSEDPAPGEPEPGEE
jgi:Skp family chaperone for outer membrane proteins